MSNIEIKRQMRQELSERWAEKWPEGANPDRPPIFSAAGKAAQRLRATPQYRLARNICVMADPVLLQVRINALQDGKNLLAATPGLKQGLIRVTPNMVPVIARSRDLRGGALFKAGRPLRLPEDLPGKVDMIIGPAMAADANGNLLGDGRGLLDLICAILGRVGSLGKKTSLAAIVDHEQIIDSVPVDEWDVPAGMIVTAEDAKNTGAAIAQPVFWGDMPEKLTNLPLVQAVNEISG